MKVSLSISLFIVLWVLLASPSIAQDSRRPGGANASFATREFRGTNDQTIRFSLFTPPQRSAENTSRSNEKLPLVLCLHGSGGNTAAANVVASAEQQKKHPCVVMAPACDSRTEHWVDTRFRRGPEKRPITQELLEALDSVVKEANIDMTRIYVTGQSLGGVGTWGLISKYPERFAAAVPVCGIWSPEDAPKMNGVAVWAFHGDQDATVPVTGSREMIAALKKAAVTPEPRYTEFPGVGHGSWTPAYATPELWDWMFSQQKTAPAAAK
jgi:predicted peptidase